MSSSGYHSAEAEWGPDIAYEMRTANLLAYLGYLTRAGVDPESLVDMAQIVGARITHGLISPEEDPEENSR